MITYSILEIRSGEYFWVPAGNWDYSFIAWIYFYLDKFEYLLKWLFSPVIISIIIPPKISESPNPMNPQTSLFTQNEMTNKNAKGEVQDRGK